MDNLWTFKHEPKKFDDIILNRDIKPKLRKNIRELPNMLLYGKPGVGKGTYAHILLRTSGIDYLWINASDETGIDAMRDKVKSFAQALGTKGLKIVVLNEADSLSAGPQGAQKMLRQMMEDVQKITRFLLLANYEHLFIPEIKSRCQVIEMSNPPARDIFSFCGNILKSERVKYNKKTVLDIVKKCYPDIRKTVEVMQENTFDGVLKSSVISRSENLFKNILGHVLSGNVEALRKELKSNVVDYIGLYEYLFENVGEFKSPGDAVIEIGEHLYRNDAVAIKEINFMQMIFSMMKRGIV